MKKVSLKAVIDAAYSKSSLLKDLLPADAILYSLEALRLIGHPLIYSSKENVFVNIENYKGVLPSDMIKLNQIMALVNYDQLQLIDTTELQVNQYQTPFDSSQVESIYTIVHSLSSPASNRYYTIPMRTSTDNFNSSTSHNYNRKSLSYNIIKSTITTQFKEGIVIISYEGLDIDEEGLPLIPDDVSVSLAIQTYIRMCHFTNLYELGKIQESILNNVQREYVWYVGQAESSLRMYNMNNADYRESLTNVINQMILNKTSHSKGFSDLGDAEQLKRW